MAKIIIIALIVTVVALVGLGIAESVINSMDAPATTSIYESGESEELKVTITGQVNNGGTFLVKLDSELHDLIDAAGGLTSNADTKAFEMDYALTNGGSYYIAPLYENGATCSLNPISKVCINTDDKDTLDNLNAFSATVAGNIVSYRESNGNFHAIEELKNVPGIGNATFEKCKDFVTLC